MCQNLNQKIKSMMDIVQSNVTFLVQKLESRDSKYRFG